LSSRIAASAKSYEAFVRVPIGQRWPPVPEGFVRPVGGIDEVPSFLAISADGAHLAVDWGGYFDIRNADGSVVSVARKYPGYAVTLENASYSLCGDDYSWLDTAEGTPYRPVGASVSLAGCSGRGRSLASRREGKRRVVADSGVEWPSSHEDGYSTVGVAQDRLSADGKEAELLGHNGFPAMTGVAAIGSDLRTVLALSDRTLRVLSSTEFSQEMKAVVQATIRTSYHVTALSLVPPHVALLVVEHDRAPALHVLDGELYEIWSLVLSFVPGEQPPIDVTDGRLVITGAGLAAVEKGKIVWWQPSTTAVRATAFVDGTLAVAVGPELRIVSRDGAIRQSFHTDEGDVITTPPAIAPDGTIWVATSKALYVAR
jgi:hypothetical protein